MATNRKIINRVGNYLMSLGYSLIGDLKCTDSRQLVVRGFANDHICAAIIFSVFGDWNLQMVTHFADGCSLTTHTNMEAITRTTEKRHYQVIDKKPFGGDIRALIDVMLLRHTASVQALHAQGRQPLAVPSSAQELAKAQQSYNHEVNEAWQCV